MSADAPGTLAAFKKENNLHQMLLSDFPRRQMLSAYDALQTDPKSPVFHYAKRAYFIIDKTGTVRYIKVMENPLDLLAPEEVLQAMKSAGV